MTSIGTQYARHRLAGPLHLAAAHRLPAVARAHPPVAARPRPLAVARAHRLVAARAHQVAHRLPAVARAHHRAVDRSPRVVVYLVPAVPRVIDESRHLVVVEDSYVERLGHMEF